MTLPDQPATVPIGIMASGTGSNFLALLQADLTPGMIVAFATDRPGCGAQSHAEKAGIPVYASTVTRATKTQFEEQVIAHFQGHGVQIIALCGYMRLVSSRMIEAFPRGILNIHPSLLPAFPGLNAPGQAFEHGVKVTGCTIHLVDTGMDTGPILAQAAVPVMDEDNEFTLAARILVEEHRLYAPTLARWCRGEYQRIGRRMVTSHRT